LTRDGALLAYSGFEAKDAKIIAAMASSIFAAHQRVRQTPGTVLPQNIVGSGDLNMILLDAEVSLTMIFYYFIHQFIQEGKMAIAAVATQLVCMVSKTNVQLGMLKAKVNFLNTIYFLLGLILFRWMLLHHTLKNHYFKYPKAITNINIRTLDDLLCFSYLFFFVAVNDTPSGQEHFGFFFVYYFIEKKD
jgi:hypothetical protein